MGSLRRSYLFFWRVTILSEIDLKKLWILEKKRNPLRGFAWGLSTRLYGMAWTQTGGWWPTMWPSSSWYDLQPREPSKIGAPQSATNGILIFCRLGLSFLRAGLWTEWKFIADITCISVYDQRFLIHHFRQKRESFARYEPPIQSGCSESKHFALKGRNFFQNGPFVLVTFHTRFVSYSSTRFISFHVFMSLP